MTVMTGNSIELGRILKQLRSAVPLTLQELSHAAHVSASHIGRIERGERFPSGHILRKLAGPLQIKEVELMAMAGFLSNEPVVSESTGSLQLDPYVRVLLLQEPVEFQRAAVTLLIILKSLAGSLHPNPVLPEFRDYVREKYPYLDEDLVTMMEDLIKRGKGVAEGEK